MIESGYNVLKLFTISDCQANSPLFRNIMDYSWRRTLELDNGYYCGNFRPYWQPHYQPQRRSVYVMQVPVPVQLVRKDGIQTFSMGNSNFYGKSKSKATRIRDKIRKQSFLENKTLCLALPFYGLEAEAFRSEMARKEDGKEVSKLKSASKTIQELQIVNEKLNSTINSLQCRFTEERKKNEEMKLKLQKQDEEQTKIEQNLQYEKKNVTKFVSQNVERQREINSLREELTRQVDLCSRGEEVRNMLQEHATLLCSRVSVLEKEKQNWESLLDYMSKNGKER